MNQPEIKRTGANVVKLFFFVTYYGDKKNRAFSPGKTFQWMRPGAYPKEELVKVLGLTQAGKSC